MSPTLRMGWRVFHCTECGRKWEEATRDCFSPSGEDCKCGETCRPEHGMVDLSLPVDASGNLTMPLAERTKETNPKDAKFTAEIEGGQLVIKIGVNVLAFAALRKNGGPLVENERVDDADQFAKDVLSELTKEEENGDTPIYKLLDQAIRDAAENGCIAIRTLKRKPREI